MTVSRMSLWSASITNGALIDHEEPAYHLSPLYLACAEGDKAMVALLLRQGACPVKANSYGRTPLIVAAR